MMMQIYRIKRGLVREIIEDFPEMKAFLQSIYLFAMSIETLKFQ